MAEQREYQLTLSRWHKVADRARKLAGEFEANCREQIAGWSASVVGAETAFAEAATVESSVDAAQADHGRLLAAWAAIRLALARANVEFGVAELLGRAETLKAEAELAERLAERQGLDSMGEARAWVHGREKLIERLAAAPPDKEVIRQMDSLASEGRPFLPVSQGWRAERQARAQALRREIVRLHDRLADLNARQVRVALDIEVAEALGLD